MLLCLVALLVIAPVEPHTFRFLVRQGLVYQAARYGNRLTIGSMEGNLFEPLRFHQVEVRSTRPGFSLRTRIRKAEAGFSWSAAFLGRGHSFFDYLDLEEPRSLLSFHAGPVPDSALSRPWLPLPARLELRGGHFDVRMEGRSVTFSGLDFSVSSSAPGTLAVEALTIRTPAFERAFTRLRGTTALQGNRLVVADIALAPDLWLSAISTDITWIAAGELRLGFDFAAFGGELRGDLVNPSGEASPDYLISGNFRAISVASLARFLGVREKTGGTIQEGKFTFQGSPHHWADASLTTRLEATDFLWGERRWNSFILGATVHNGRVEIPALELHQAHNTLVLSGEVTIPARSQPWWEAGFEFDVNARIDNLTELSALLGPRFADTAGKVTVVGAIRGRNQLYHGQLIVTGSHLAYRGAPIEVLNAGIKLDGNELQVINLELANGRDFIRGKGGINIYGEKWYWGELNASIHELTDYRALLQKPITPAPLVGGMEVQWKGDGTTMAHSGAFNATFRQIHTPGTEDIPATLPIDAELEGTYSTGNFFLRKCVLAAKGTRLETRLASTATALRLEEVRLTHKDTLWLEGEAVLPVNLWQWWQAPSLAALAPEAPLTVGLTARGVHLDDVANLTGKPIPIRGVLSGSVTSEGTLRDVRMKGSLKLERGRIPANAWLPALDEVEAEAEMEGSRLRFTSFRATHPVGRFTASGEIDFTPFENPLFSVALRSDSVALTPANGWQGRAGLDLTLTGTRESAQVSGSATLLELETAPVPDFAPLLLEGRTSGLVLPRPALVFEPSYARWHFAIALETPRPLALPGGGTVAARLRYRGDGAQPLVPRGTLSFTDLPLALPHGSARVENATFLWEEAEETGPRLSARIAGKASEARFTAYYVGAARSPAFSFASEPAMDESQLRHRLQHGYALLPPEAAEFAPELAAPFDRPLPDLPPPSSTPTPEPEPETAGATPTPPTPPAEPSPEASPLPSASP